MKFTPEIRAAGREKRVVTRDGGEPLEPPPHTTVTPTIEL
jgi:hypothetical protein